MDDAHNLNNTRNLDDARNMGHTRSTEGDDPRPTDNARNTDSPRPPNDARDTDKNGTPNLPSSQVLLTESVADKLIRYAQVESTSSDEGEGVPSTPQQWQMARLLSAELQAMGLEKVEVDRYGIVMATLPANPADLKAPVVGLIAHYDTVPRVPGAGVRPIMHHHYDGGEIQLSGSGTVLSPQDCPLLNEVVGHDIITSDGTTLLGADDKAGVADIMAALCQFLTHPEWRHGTIKVAFTPDEETGRGVEFFDVARFGADFAYTVDGGELGELEAESFEAENLEIRLTGRSAHTGSARGVMINALHLASTLIAAIPATQRPETTDGRLGFLHPERLDGNVEQARLLVLVRDFTVAGLEAKKEYLRTSLDALMAAYPGATYEIRRVGGYHNMASELAKEPRLVELAAQAMQELGIPVKRRAIRGGTDGARLTCEGLLTPNLFTGGANFHSRQEWASVQWMEQAVAVLVRLLQLWADQELPVGRASRR
ncbi:MAG: peptidase T [Limnochordaceae bacterium]|nr:peptidase T [Limnochordaceae bacterium]